LQLAFDALQLGGTASTILNAVNEIAVPAFLNKQIQFMDVPAVIAKALDAIPVVAVSSLEQLIDTDAEARRFAEQCLGNIGAKKVLTA
jgi:1-deoxy-D-xylulose-5-phosphate reductoisomerase